MADSENGLVWQALSDDWQEYVQEAWTQNFFGQNKRAVSDNILHPLQGHNDLIEQYLQVASLEVSEALGAW